MREPGEQPRIRRRSVLAGATAGLGLGALARIDAQAQERAGAVLLFQRNAHTRETRANDERTPSALVEPHRRIAANRERAGGEVLRDEPHFLPNREQRGRLRDSRGSVDRGHRNRSAGVPG